MKYYVIAGEASGDLHASNLINALKGKDTNAEFRAWGGDRIKQTGATLVKHYRDLAFMGFVEVVKNLRTILDNLKFCKQDIIEFNPDVLILVDYPGFNLRIAKWARQQGYKVFYYISPQVWAWNKKRVKHIKRDVDEMFVILPFEQEFYKGYGVDVHFIGHPLLDVIPGFEGSHEFSLDLTKTEQKIIALLPGSRKQEVKRMLPVMVELAGAYADHLRFVLAAAPSIELDFYQDLIAGNKITVLQDQTYDILLRAHAAIVTSGTATLETCLFNVPQVVCYEGNAASFALAKRIVDVPFISLVNLIADEEVVKELIQQDYNLSTLNNEFTKLLEKGPREKIFKGYEKVRSKLGTSGASERAAAKMNEILKNKTASP